MRTVALWTTPPNHVWYHVEVDTWMHLLECDPCTRRGEPVRTCIGNIVWNRGPFGYVARPLAAGHNFRGMWNTGIVVHLVQEIPKYTHQSIHLQCVTANYVTCLCINLRRTGAWVWVMRDQSVTGRPAFWRASMNEVNASPVSPLP